jgi:hypothetical protein
MSLSDYGYGGLFPHTRMEWDQARTEKMYADEDEADRRARFEEAPDTQGKSPTMDVCKTSITPEMYANLNDCEAVTVRKYENEDGSQFAKVIGVGTEAEMAELAETPALLLVLPPIKEITQYVLPVSELLPPSDK